MKYRIFGWFLNVAIKNNKYIFWIFDDVCSPKFEKYLNNHLKY